MGNNKFKSQKNAPILDFLDEQRLKAVVRRLCYHTNLEPEKLLRYNSFLHASDVKRFFTFFFFLRGEWKPVWKFHVRPLYMIRKTDFSVFLCPTIHDQHMQFSKVKMKGFPHHDMIDVILFMYHSKVNRRKT